MSTPFVVYDTATGLIKAVGRAMDAKGGVSTAWAQTRGTDAVLVGQTADPETQYVDPSSGTLRERPALTLTVDKTTITADGVDTATISGVPAGARYAVLGTAVAGDVADGVIEVTSTKRGTLTVVVWHGVSRPWKVDITAV